MNIESIKNNLLVKYPLFGSVIANSNFVENPQIETAATDGKNIYYNPDFIKSLTSDEKTFIFAHEICHIAFNHIYRSEGKNPKLWNIATDSVINASLKQDGLPLIKGGIDIPEAINYDAEEMYEKLLKEKNNQNDNEETNQSNNNPNENRSDNMNQNDKNQSSSNNDKDGNSNEESKGNDTHDDHSMWSKAVENKHNEEQNNKKKNNNTKEELSEKETFKQNKTERKKRLEELRNKLASSSHGYGDTTNSEIRDITDIGISKPLFDWRRLLKEAVKHDIDWSYQNAEIEEGVVTAHLEEFPIPETEIVLDTSGSIDEFLLRNFLRECKNILQTSKVKVGCFDTKFYGFTEIKNISDIDKLPFYGGGGTNFDVAVSAFTRRVENKIIFTDGEAPMPSTRVDAIWIVFGGIRINPPGGKVIYIDEEELEEIYNYQMINETKGRTK